MSSDAVIVVGQGIELRRVLALLEEDQQQHLAGVVPWRSSHQIESGPVSQRGISGSRLLGPIEDLAAIVEKYPASVVLALSRPGDRWEALGCCRQAGVSLKSLSSKHSVIAPDTDLREGSIVTQSCLIESTASVGVGALLLPGARLGIGARCGDASVLDAGASLDDGARIGDEVHLGSGSRVLEGRIVGQGALVLPGSIVTSDIEPGTIVAGSPAEVVERSISIEEGESSGSS